MGWRVGTNARAQVNVASLKRVETMTLPHSRVLPAIPRVVSSCAIACFLTCLPGPPSLWGIVR